MDLEASIKKAHDVLGRLDLKHPWKWEADPFSKFGGRWKIKAPDGTGPTVHCVVASCGVVLRVVVGRVYKDFFAPDLPRETIADLAMSMGMLWWADQR